MGLLAGGIQQQAQQPAGVCSFMFLGLFVFFIYSSYMKPHKRAPSSLLRQSSLGPAPTPPSQKLFLHSDFA